MGSEFPYLYPYSHAEARRLKETQRYEDSFRVNVSCARAIEQAIRDHFNETDETLSSDCAQSVLEQFGFKRVNFVLANSLQELQKSINCKHLVSDETYRWGRKTLVPSDGKYNRYFAVDTAAALLESFIGQARDAYQALGLFGPEHCVGGDRHEQDYKGKVLVMSPDTLRESCWDPRDQLWLAEGGFGCSPTASGRAVYATCLGDGEKTRWDRSDFVGVLDEQHLPDWAREKLEELRGAQQEQESGPAMGGMTMQ
ncbi:MAG: DUF3849 domain-containing protein [Oscillospiraceae bacterium]|nr:DUF3849 domain-containing protein [Oscillospiraceae bacterium]